MLMGSISLEQILSAAILIILLLLLFRRRGGRFGQEFERVVSDELRLGREEVSRESRNLREEVAQRQKEANDSLISTLLRIGDSQKTQLDSVLHALRELTSTNQAAIDKLRETVEAQFRQIQESNERKLEQMRQTVDEKLHSTLEKRLGESFKLVGERLEAVQRGLGEMQSLASGVGDLKRVLTNVKDRGTWGEIQLAAILEGILTPDQYEKNVTTREGSDEHVEFAIRLPGRNNDMENPVWLPIDSKFPKEDYERLVDATQAADRAGVEEATESLKRAIKKFAKDISEKYLDPPHTTDFAIMFLPTEGLYAEILRQPGLHDELQRKHRVLVTGPTILSAFLNSLRMGFRTLAIEKRSSEVWEILAAVKTEFGKFGEVLDRVRKQLSTASNTIEETAVRTRVMERRLRSVESLPSERATQILQIPESTADDVDTIS